MPIGLGSHTQWDEKLDGRLAAALMSMPSVKAVEIGDGLAQTARRGSTVHDVITYDATAGWSRRTNNAGGTRGRHHQRLPGRRARRRQADLHPHQAAAVGRSADARGGHRPTSSAATSASIPAAGVVGEAMVALVLADAFRQKFGGDSIAEIEKNYEAVCQHLPSTAS